MRMIQCPKVMFDPHIFKKFLKIPYCELGPIVGDNKLGDFVPCDNTLFK